MTWGSVKMYMLELLYLFGSACRGTFLEEARGVLESISNGGSEFSGRHYKSRNIN